VAFARLRLELVSWQNPSSHWALVKRDTASLTRLSEDAGFAALVPGAAKQAASLLGLSGPHEVLQTVHDLSQELSLIEALRERLLTRVEKLCLRMARLRNDAPRTERLFQVNRLSLVASRQLRSRFAEVDAHMADFGALMGNIENERSFIRTNRDWLYRSQRAWEPLLDEWDQVREAVDDIADLLGDTYHFLAPRFMPTQEWMVHRGPRRQATAPAQMVW
jgi:small-conductance mechanosensitive channel